MSDDIDNPRRSAGRRQPSSRRHIRTGLLSAHRDATQRTVPAGLRIRCEAWRVRNQRRQLGPHDARQQRAERREAGGGPISASDEPLAPITRRSTRSTRQPDCALHDVKAYRGPWSSAATMPCQAPTAAAFHPRKLAPRRGTPGPADRAGTARRCEDVQSCEPRPRSVDGDSPPRPRPDQPRRAWRASAPCGSRPRIGSR